MRVGAWVAFRAGGSLGPPETLPLGRAGLALQREGHELVLGQPGPAGGFEGVIPRPGRWEAVHDLAVEAVYDRFPSASRAAEFTEGVACLGSIPLGNAPRITALCRDKLQSQHVLAGAGVAMPEVCGDPSVFAEHLEAWGTAFIKPRHGSFGRGVRRVRPGDPLPVEGAWVLQRAISPPVGFGAGLALRVLVQRVPGAGWLARSPVARVSADDPVVNAARGASVHPAEDLGLDVAGIQRLALDTALALECTGGLTLELGVDVVIDHHAVPWVIEVNSRPRGRLRAVADRWSERFAAEHTDACIAPFRQLITVVQHR